MSRQESFPNDIWSTEPFASCSANAKYLYRWSRANPACRVAGIYRVKVAQAALDTSLTPSVIDRALAELRERSMVFFVDGVLWNVRRLADYHTKTRQTAVAAAKDVCALPEDHPLRLAFLAYYADRRCGFNPGDALHDALVERVGADAIPPQIEVAGIPAIIAAGSPVPIALVESPRASTGPSRDDARDVFDAWSEATGKTNRTEFEGDREKLIRRWLATYPKDDLIDAVRGWRHSAHHRGENERGTVYNDLPLLLRNTTNIERFRDLERGALAGEPDQHRVSQAELRQMREASA